MTYKIGAFDTVIEGNYNEVMTLINDINEHLYSKGWSEWISNIQIQIRSNEDITGDEKTSKFK